jgi:hypothetical protein
MNYLTEYYRNKSIVLEQRVKELQDILVLVENNKNYYLEENWREYLAKLVGGAADEVAAAAGKKLKYTEKLHPSQWHRLVKEDLQKFAGPPLRWIREGATGEPRLYILKIVKGKNGIETYEIWTWNEGAGQWVQKIGGSSPWGQIGKVSHSVNPPSPGMVPGPNGWQNASARLSSDMGDAGPVRATVAGSQTQDAGGSDEEITI